MQSSLFFFVMKQTANVGIRSLYISESKQKISKKVTVPPVRIELGILCVLFSPVYQ